MSTTTGLAPTGHEPNPMSNQQQQQQQGTSISTVPNITHNPSPPTPPPPPPRLTTVQTFIRRAPSVKHPHNDLLGTREDYIKFCVPLYQASMNGDWEVANRILSKRKELVRFSITENYETALHIATSAQHTKFVELLMKLMEDKDLELQNKNGNTALCLAAMAGNVQITQMMVNKNKGLLTIQGSQKMMPLYIAALFGDHNTVKYLYDHSKKMTDDFWTSENRGWVLLKCIEADLFDIALKILQDCSELAQNGSVLGVLGQDRQHPYAFNDVLGVLARKPYAFKDIKPHFIWKIINSILAVVQLKVGPTKKESEAMKLLKIIWKNIVKMPKDEIDNILRGRPDTTMKDGKKILNLKNENLTFSSRILFLAVEMGNTKFVVELIREYPDLIWKLNDNKQSIFHAAVSHRQESIFNLIYELGSMKDMILPLKDIEENNILHLVGKKAEKNRPEDVSGVAFQMQRELLWFKAVEAVIPPSYTEKKNAAGLTPRALFTKNHEELVSKGELWMKGTANQCMVVAALIATIVFAVAFTIPGGYSQSNGFPMFLRKEIFIVFVISDAISLIFSSASILMFLSILTSRYAEQDFFESLPQKLMIGLATLFLSIMTMMVAFSVSFFVLYHNKLVWVPTMISALAALPVILYAKLQYPLLVDAFRVTYGSRYLFKPKKHMLYNINPKF